MKTYIYSTRKGIPTFSTESNVAGLKGRGESKNKFTSCILLQNCKYCHADNGKYEMQSNEEH